MRFFLILILLLSACSSRDPDTAQEIAPPGAKVTDSSEVEMYEEAKGHYERELYSLASESFQELINTFPSGAYTEIAELKIADSKFRLSQFGAAAEAYESFIKNHPASDSAEYATFQSARSYFTGAPEAGRDQTFLKKARKILEGFIEKYPNSVFRRSAKSMLTETMTKLAEHEKIILKYYESNSTDKAYQRRKKIFEQEWQKHLNNE